MKIKSREWITAILLIPLVLVSAARGGVAPMASSELTSNLLLKVSGNGRYLVDQTGAPFLIVGDSPWSLIVQVNETDREMYLADRQTRGFNSLIINLLEHKFTTRAPNTLTGLAPFNTPGDFSTPNDAYFDLAHQVVQQAGEHGMVVWLTPAYLGYGGGDEGFFREIKAGGREKLRAYGTYIGKRFKDLPNIVWMLGGDYTPDAPDQWVVNDLARAIRAEDPEHLMTAHHSPEGSAVGAFGEQDWLTVNNFYGYEKTLYRPMLAEYARRPVRPYVLQETTYEDEHDSTPDLIRRQAYWAMLSGACGQFFGNNPIWHFDGPTLFPFKLPWRQALDAAGSRDMTHLRELLVQLPWQELAPEANHRILSEGYGTGAATALTVSTADGTLAVAYIPSTGKDVHEVTVSLSSFAKAVTARWYNPTNGQFVVVKSSPFANRGTQRLRSPGDNGTGANDWALILDAR